MIFRANQAVPMRIVHLISEARLTHTEGEFNVVCALRCDNIRYAMPNWANQVSLLQKI
ncbi:MAG: hypothetical protein ACFNLL_08590 [Bacteroides sp.]